MHPFFFGVVDGAVRSLLFFCFACFVLFGMMSGFLQKNEWLPSGFRFRLPGVSTPGIPASRHFVFPAFRLPAFRLSYARNR
jgi:hypothetical protein